MKEEVHRHGRRVVAASKAIGGKGSQTQTVGGRPVLGQEDATGCSLGEIANDQLAEPSSYHTNPSDHHHCWRYFSDSNDCRLKPRCE